MATRMFTWIWIFEIVLHGVVALGPTAADFGNITSCEEFERDAYFAPNEIIDSVWKIFYFWADTTEMTPIVFSLLTPKLLRRYKTLLDSIDPGLEAPVHRAHLLMEPRPGVQILMLHQDTPGAYRAFIMTEQRQSVRPYPKPKLDMADVRMKQVGRLIGMMSCEMLTAYAMARVREMPVTEADCIAAANKLGFQAPGGKSYLYVKSLMKSEL